MIFENYTTFLCYSNEDEIEDDDTNEESSLKSKNRDMSEGNSEIAEPSPGPSASSETQPLDTEDRAIEDSEDKYMWPAITDLNTRLRRVITSYQRNCRREEQKLAASKAKVKFSHIKVKILLRKSKYCLNCFCCFTIISSYNKIHVLSAWM